ncbi:DUF167 domain-containing protein [Silvibacterium acidisoli]|uniref:DUF167 domain-containing protein n=1 Tax=Acidobacteriaceae bacterium ZG23-2 TaxID=2883246 RepID=UPI00406CCD22
MSLGLADAVRDAADGAILAVRVTPRASRTKITGLYVEGAEARIKVAVAAPPVDGRSNEALLAFAAEVLGVSSSAVSLIAGQTSRSKRLKVAGLTAAQVCTALSFLVG